MKEERRGLRVREYLVMVFTLWVLPYWLLLVKFGDPEQFTWREGGVVFVWALAATILACVAESRLEARGRYVESGVDVREMVPWLQRNGYRFNLVAALFGCAIIVLLSTEDRETWGMAVAAGCVALNTILAVMGKPASGQEER